MGPYFFVSADEVVTVNGNRYREIITEFLWPALNNSDLEDM